VSLEKNKAILARVVEEFINKNKSEEADALFSADFVNHNPSFGVSPDRVGIKEMIRLFHVAFPDYKMTIEDIIAEDDRVAVRMTAEGTHKGEILGIKPTGNRIDVMTISIVRISNDRIVERWNITNELEVMKEMGLM